MSECLVPEDGARGATAPYLERGGRAKAVPVTSTKTIYEFQIFYLANEGAAGELRSMLVRAETLGQAEALLSGFRIVSVGPGRPVMDWGKPYFSRTDVEAYACCSTTTVTKAIALGLLRAAPGRNVFSRKEIDAWLEGPAQRPRFTISPEATEATERRPV